MPLPAPLSRGDPRVSKKDFGHLLIIAGSPSMLGAAALTSLAAMKSGAGRVTAAVPKGSNLTFQQKISHVVMTLPLAQTRTGAFSVKAYGQLKEIWDRFDAIAIGPGIGRLSTTGQLVRRVILDCPKPLVVDADALYALGAHADILLKAKGSRILTPHEGEMSRLTGTSIKRIQSVRLKIACDFARHYNCVLLLKGHHTVVASQKGLTYINTTGNSGMATAGSGDVLTGMITAFLGQGIEPFKAACWGAYLHGTAGDHAAKIKSKAGMIATDIIECIFYEK
ncbi:MAG: NAD(P)H-hydrate dehydratase [Candidatus Omnitrophica bacterium]|nr:NAD(P)H-hydrate dehydratase [Candidatus Omnitrophota bacterium]